MSANLENSTVVTGLEKLVFIPIQNKGNGKECSNYCTSVLISYPNKVMLKILQAQVQQYVNQELLDTKWVLKLGFEQAEQQIKLPTFTRSWRKQENFRKIPTFVSLPTTLKLSTEELLLLNGGVGEDS